MQKYLDMLTQYDAEGKLVKPDSVITAPWTILKCQFGCSSYGRNLCCPPYTPAYDETRIILDSYKTLILFHSTDKKNITHLAVRIAKELFLDGYYKSLAFGSGPCNLCETCSLARPCRNSSLAAPSMEACGIDVFATARKNGFQINTLRAREEQNHNFGLLLVE